MKILRLFIIQLFFDLRCKSLDKVYSLNHLELCNIMRNVVQNCHIEIIWLLIEYFAERLPSEEGHGRTKQISKKLTRSTKSTLEFQYVTNIYRTI